MNLPLEPKKRRGRTKKRKIALCRDEVEENFLEDGEFQIEEYGIQTIAPILSPKKTATKSSIIKKKVPKPKKTTVNPTRSSKRLREIN